MIRDDELDGVGPAKSGPARVVSGQDYLALRVVVSCGLVFVFGLACVGIARSFGVPFPAGLIGGSGYGATLASGPLVDAWLRRRGLARPAKAAATWTRAPLLPDAEGDAEVVEVGIAPATLWAGILAGLVLILFFGGMLLLSRSVGRNDRIDWFFVAFMVLGALGMAWMMFVGCWLKPTIRVDAEGVWGYPRDLAIRRRFVPWSAIKSAEVETYIGLAGKRAAVRPILYDRHGDRLIRLDVTGIARADQERLVGAIRARLHRPAG